MPPVDPSGLIGLILGVLGVLGLEPTVRDWRRRLKAWKIDRARRRRAEGAVQDYYYSSYEYAVRLVDHGTEALSIRRVSVVSLSPDLREVKVRVAPRTGREIEAVLSGNGVTLIQAPPDEAIPDARVFLIRFNPSLKAGMSASYELRTHTLVWDGSRTPEGVHRVTWGSAGRRADRAVMRVVLPYSPSKAWYKTFDAQGSVVGDQVALEPDPLTFELRHEFTDIDPTHRHAIVWDPASPTA